jgi:hypothetical protein
VDSAAENSLETECRPWHASHISEISPRSPTGLRYLHCSINALRRAFLAQFKHCADGCGRPTPNFLSVCRVPTRLFSRVVKAAEEVIKKGPVLDEADRLSIVIISSEVSPYSKSGGLADVADKLGSALAKLGETCTIGV